MKQLLTITALMLLVLQVNAQVKKFSLQEAVAFAKANNTTLKNNKLEVLSARKKVMEVASGIIPNISAEGSYLHNLQIPTQRLPNFINNALPPESPRGPEFIDAQFGVPFSVAGKVTASQLLFDGGFFMGLKASQEFVQLSQINLERNEVQTTIDVSRAYYLVLLAQTNINLLSSNLTQLEKTQFDLEQLAKNGLLDKIESDRINLQTSNLKIQLAKLKDQEKVALMLLKLQMGMNVNEPIELSDDLETLFKNKQVKSKESTLDMKNRVEYRLLLQQEKLYTLSKKRYQYGYAPSLVGFITHQQNTFGQKLGDIGDLWFPGTFYGVTLNVPIFDGLRKRAQIQQEDINLKITRNNIENLERAINVEVNSAQFNYTRTSEQLDIQKKNLELAQEIFNRVQLKYNNGLASTLELTVSQTDLETARTNYITAVYDFFIAEMDYQKALGNIK